MRSGFVHRIIFLYYYKIYLIEMPWIPPERWVVISSYRNIPLPIKPVPPLPKRGASTRKVLELIAKKKSGLKKEGESNADGPNGV
jgi:hypothetical protein